MFNSDGSTARELLCRSLSSLTLCCRHAANDVRVSRISDAESCNSVVFAAGCAELYVITSVMMNSSLSQHCIVLDLTLPKWRSVVSNDDKLCLALSKRLQCLPISQNVFTTFHDKCESSVNAFDSLFRFLLCNHLDSRSPNSTCYS